MVSSGGSGGIVNSYRIRYLIVEDCIFADNGGIGLYATGSSMIRCIFRDNSGYGFYTYGNANILDCLFLGNTDDNCFIRSATSGRSIIQGNHFDGSTASGMRFDRISSAIIKFNRFVNNGNYGLELDGVMANTHEDYNVFYGNTTGDLKSLDGGVHSYGDDAAHHISDPDNDGVDADYQIETGKELRSVEMQLDWA